MFGGYVDNNINLILNHEMTYKNEKDHYWFIACFRILLI
jgi:hypothetical protein